MSNNKKYWKSIEDLQDNPEFIKKQMNEFAEPIPFEALTNADAKGDDTSGTNRRDFLKYMGFSVTAASLAACETPVRNVIPYVNKPEEVTPGVASYYASSYYDGNEFASILVKTREGRPIKFEYNEKGSVKGISSRVQASVLSLYDSARLRFATKNNSEIAWDKADAEVTAKLAKSTNIRIVTNTIISPSTKAVVAEFTAKYPSTKHVANDAISYNAIVKANEFCFGKAVIPAYKFDQAQLVISVGADFLGTWLDVPNYSGAYAKNRKPTKENPNMSKLVSFEAIMSLTGANADYRFQTKPSQYGAVLVTLYNEIAKLQGTPALTASVSEYAKEIAALAKELVAAKGKSLVICGANDVNLQKIVNGINVNLGNVGATVDVDNHSNLFQGDDAAFEALIAEMASGKVDAIIINGANPAYTNKAFAAALPKVGLRISTADRADETASLCEYIMPDSNFLESWNDFNPAVGVYALQQPTIQALGKTRQFQDTLLKLAGATKNYYSTIQSTWETTFGANGEGSVTAFWNKALHDGLVLLTPPSGVTTSSCGANCGAGLSEAATKIAGYKGGAWELVMYQKNMGTGTLANNPWLQELPDPISKVCWDNYITMSPVQMKEMGLTTLLEQESKMSVIEISVNGVAMKVPVFPSPGQKANTIGLALGYGRTLAGKVGNNVGVNGYPAVKFENGNYSYLNINTIVGTKEIDKAIVATTQTHQTLMGRHIIHEASLAEFKKDPKAGNEREFLVLKDGKTVEHKTAQEMDLWATPSIPGHERPNHFWNMSLDLNSCTGCGDCVTACNVENNIAVVGKDEIRRGREMHWLRIDRYYSSDSSQETGKAGMIGNYLDMEIASANPSVVFQPVMCQHCNHAPCENVCPVLATTHSSEGLNQMTYNRCVGTRYCANNCPYKVRRFNWFRYTENEKFDYTMLGEVERMVLNPDVTVRTRGVIEKCSMCVQRIQEGKLKAKKESRRPVDGEIKTACQQACSTGAIIFGDNNDTTSAVTKAKADDRMYHLLEELNVQPSVFYQTKIRNNEGTKFFAEAHHEAGHEAHAEGHATEAHATTEHHN
ncbi:MAG: TAT-variant-translocated molybdopterin oxidoreductase [Bacteroidia bacterium]